MNHKFKYRQIEYHRTFPHLFIEIYCYDNDTAKELSEYLNDNWYSLFKIHLGGMVNNYHNSKVVTIVWGSFAYELACIYGKLMRYADKDNQVLNFYIEEEE